MAEKRLLNAAEAGSRTPRLKRNRYSFPRLASPRSATTRFEKMLEILVNEVRVVGEKIDELIKKGQ